MVLLRFLFFPLCSAASLLTRCSSSFTDFSFARFNFISLGLRKNLVNKILMLLFNFCCFHCKGKRLVWCSISHILPSLPQNKKLVANESLVKYVNGNGVAAGVMEDFAGSFEAEGRWKKEEAREEPGDFAEALKQKTCHMVCWHGLKLVMWVYLHRLRLVK